MDYRLIIHNNSRLWIIINLWYSEIVIPYRPIALTPRAGTKKTLKRLVGKPERFEWKRVLRSSNIGWRIPQFIDVFPIWFQIVSPHVFSLRCWQGESRRVHWHLHSNCSTQLSTRLPTAVWREWIKTWKKWAWHKNIHNRLFTYTVLYIYCLYWY